MYEKYYAYRSNEIAKYLEELKEENQKIAIWSAGKRGAAFLEIFDTENCYIDYVFDINPCLWGKHMETGHAIADFHKIDVDVIIFIDPAYEMDSIIKLRGLGIKTKICCLDNIIFGKLPLNDMLNSNSGPVQLRHIRKVKIASLTILYNPDISDVLQNIQSYGPYVERVYIFDNSSISHEESLKNLEDKCNIRYIFGGGKNHGLGEPINIVAEEIQNEGFEWLITFDQDSRFPVDAMKDMRCYVESTLCFDEIGLVGPNVFRNHEKIDKNTLELIPFCTYKHEIIQSGAMHRLKAFQKAGGYDEKLFIEYVDFEYCYRMRRHNYYVVQLNRTILEHQTQDDYVEFSSSNAGVIVQGKYSARRYYYRFRNFYYAAMKYGDADPILEEECTRLEETMKKKMSYDMSSNVIDSILKRAKEDAKLGRMGEVLDV